MTMHEPVTILNGKRAGERATVCYDREGEVCVLTSGGIFVIGTAADFRPERAS